MIVGSKSLTINKNGQGSPKIKIQGGILL